jgi:SAM-dependent methyltransferase
MTAMPTGWTGLQQWYQSPLGQLFGNTEARLLAGLLPALFGYHSVALGISNGTELLAASPISHRWYLDGVLPPSGGSLDLLADPDQLPLATAAVDVVVVSHLLEYVPEPQAVLREIDRVLIPEGHVLILGFNPWSLWGAWYGLRLGQLPRGARLLGVWQLRGWLARLGLEPLAIHYGCYRPPLRQIGLLARLAWLERLGARWWPQAGGAYVLLARKRVATLTPIKARRPTRQRTLTPAGVIQRLRRWRSTP